MDPKTGCFRASYKPISEKIGVSTAQLRSWLEQLEVEGYLKDESLNDKIIVHVFL